MNVICDLDGVVWLAENPIEGSAEAVKRLRAAGHRLLFVTNNSNPSVAELVAKLEGMGVAVEPDDVVTSAQAAASLVQPGQTALVCGGKGVREALEARGARTVHQGAADAVVVGFHREFDYDRLTAAFRTVIAGAQLIGTNDDPTYPTPDGPVPGGGSLLAAVATASGVDPVIAGKPHQPMADTVRARLGDDADDPTVLVGDRPSTDGLMAVRMGIPFHLVFSGVTSHDTADDGSGVTPHAVAPNLAELVDQEFA